MGRLFPWFLETYFGQQEGDMTEQICCPIERIF